MKLLAAAFFFAFAATASAQSTAGEPDVAIVTNVHARELRFATVPDPAINVSGDVNGRPAAVVSRTDRTNLPEDVQPNVTYRDIGVRLTITSTLPDIERILDEALGTTPAASDATPQPARKKGAVRKKRGH